MLCHNNIVSNNFVGRITNDISTKFKNFKNHILQKILKINSNLKFFIDFYLKSFKHIFISF